MTEVKACGAVVYRKKASRVDFLLIKHRWGGHWGLPKGHAENGESESETAIREVAEETGLAVDLHPDFRETVMYSPTPGTLKTVVYFLGRSRKKKVKVQKAELTNAVWLELEDACHLATHASTQDLLRLAYSRLAPQLKH